MCDAQSRQISVAFLHVYVNLPIPLHGTRLFVISASAVRYRPRFHLSARRASAHRACGCASC
jgi:hypothetical protein